MADTNTPMASEARTKGRVTTPSASQLPRGQMPKHDAAADHRDDEQQVADADEREQLAEDDLERRGRQRQRLLVGPALALADDAEGGADRQRLVSSMPAMMARKKSRSRSVGLNQNRCRTSMGSRARSAPRSRGTWRPMSLAAAICVT